MGAKLWIFGSLALFAVAFYKTGGSDPSPRNLEEFLASGDEPPKWRAIPKKEKVWNQEVRAYDYVPVKVWNRKQGRDVQAFSFVPPPQYKEKWVKEHLIETDTGSYKIKVSASTADATPGVAFVELTYLPDDGYEWVEAGSYFKRDLTLPELEAKLRELISVLQQGTAPRENIQKLKLEDQIAKEKAQQKKFADRMRKLEE
jgi:hypothetical protein